MRIWTKNFTKKAIRITEKYKGLNNSIYNGPILWTKVHMGWNTILNYHWGVQKEFSIPDVSEMKWTDILDTELMLMSDL